MRHPTYLHCSRHGVYYFRARTPAGLRRRHPELPIEVKASFGTKNRRFACAIAHLVFRQWVDWIADLEQQDLPIMSDRRFSSWISYDDPVRGRVYQTMPDDTPGTRAQLLEFLERRVTKRSAALPGAESGSPVEPGAPPAAQPPVAGMESPGPLPLLPDTVETPPRTAGAATAAAVTARDPAAGFTAHQGKQAEWLSDVIEQWHQHKVNTRVWKAPSTWTNAFEPDLRVFRELVSDSRRIAAPDSKPKWDIRMGDIDEAHIQTFVDATWRFPARAGQLARSADAKEILVLADERRNAIDVSKRRGALASMPVNGAEAIDDSTDTRQGVYNAKKKLGRAKVFLGWAVRMKFLSADVLVPLEVALEEGDKTDPKGGYRRFSKDELRLIFGAAEYADDGFPQAWKYFAPLLGLQTAGRVREIADLTVHDFVIVDGIPCVHFRGGDVVENGSDGKSVVRKRVKTPGSERKVPISRTLIEMGLLDYVERRRAARCEWLWDGLSWEEKSGRGRKITRWFSRFLKDLGINERRRKVFHSFRSTLNKALTDLKLDPMAIELLLGHAPTTIRGKHYTHDTSDSDVKYEMPVAAVRDTLDQIDWGVTFHRSDRWGGVPPT